MDKTEEMGKRWEEYIGSYEFRSLDECQCPMHNFSPFINLETLNGYKPAKLQSCQNFNPCCCFFLSKAYTCFQKRREFSTKRSFKLDKTKSAFCVENMRKL